MTTRTLVLRLCRAASTLMLLLGASAVFAQATSTTALSVDPNPAPDNQQVTLTAAVAGNNPRGKVTFMDGGVALQTRTVSGQNTASYSQRFAAGAHSITAVYEGDSKNTASTSDAVLLNVSASGSSTAVSSSANPSVYGSSVTFTANVTTGRGLQGGTVTFYDGGAAIGSSPVSGSGKNGSATLAVSTLAAGARAITAAYSGDANNPASTSAPLTQLVKAASTVALASSGNPSNYGQPTAQRQA
jgi:hypothetical protein